MALVLYCIEVAAHLSGGKQLQLPGLLAGEGRELGRPARSWHGTSGRPAAAPGFNSRVHGSGPASFRSHPCMLLVNPAKPRGRQRGLRLQVLSRRTGGLPSPV